MRNNIVVVDDDPVILQSAWNILSKAGMKTTVLRSGRQLLDYIEDKPLPDLILLDIMMPKMNGFEVMNELKKTKAKDVPVIFLTARDDERSEEEGLSYGAMDYIRKPFVAGVLILRVKNAVELIRLQRNLEEEVRIKTKENEQLFLHVVSSLAAAIDAKDAYTNGHSRRVAEYSREIAKRYGYNETQQQKIYMMGILHDVGKIGVPDEVINKPGKLNDEEFAQIKKHPVMGGEILDNITEMPEIADGARWHHEKYAGNGYPDGLKGEDIPEVARIIAVADAYDAMTSNRSYRKVMPQSKVRQELVDGRGTQFDPKFADIMISMIDDDKDYEMVGGGKCDK
ncbi:MAG: response regulator [Lachnospiraceae bacterium]|nr:response regulator [Lachnospiraceae bacterium]